jgi:hypothetical protein
MLRKSLITILIFALLVSGMVVITSKTTPAAAQKLQSVSVPSVALPEAPDFASLNFGDAWDMSEFTDISQYFNGAGRHPSLTNFSVANGLFSARSIGDNLEGPLAAFYPLHEGYENFMQIGGNLGSLHPINSQEYNCLYLAMKVNSKTVAGDSPDLFLVQYANETTSGALYEYLYYENVVQPNNPLIPGWRLYKVDLSSSTRVFAGKAKWQDQPYWTSFEINPTIYKDIDFQVDWVRLTSCDEEPAYQAQISWSPDASINTIWARPSGTNRDIVVARDINGSAGSYQLNTKGLAPGSYQIGLGTLSSCCTQWSNVELTVNQTPMAEVVYPSPTSGQDYATNSGNAWDLDPSDIDQISCTNASYADGLLNLQTPYPAALPSSCTGPVLGEADSRIYLNMPGPLKNASEYRYLSFQLNMEGSYAMPADGMIGRFMWTTPNGCTQVSADIPYDVGWNTYIIDLYDPFNGMPVAAAPAGCAKVPWSQTGEVVALRFDPNENYTGVYVPQMVFSQHFDWISLSKAERVVQGQSYMVGLQLNKSMDQINNIEYYFTTDPQNPIQNMALRYNREVVAPLTANHFVYLPGIITYGLPFEKPSVDTNFSWDTTGVVPGDYYICARVYDDQNESTFCSEAPVQVYNP